jgi:transposase InsO family protein
MLCQNGRKLFRYQKQRLHITIEVLRTIFARNGIPSRVVTDNGSQFTSSEFQQFMGLNGIKHIKTTPYHPSSNGLAERFVQSFKQAMRASKNDSGTISKSSPNFC